MSPVLLLSLLAQYGPSIIPVVQKLIGDIAAGRTQTTVTVEDLAELQRLANQKGEDIYLRLGIAPPPPAVAPVPVPAQAVQ